MLTASGLTKVTDFGIAKTMLGQTATKTGMILGTPFYMSPEQIRGKTLDGRSDQFALAVIAYEIFTGRKPFEADNSRASAIKSSTKSSLPRRCQPRGGRRIGCRGEARLSKRCRCAICKLL